MRTLGWVLILAALLTGALAFVACDSGSPTSSGGGCADDSFELNDSATAAAEVAGNAAGVTYANLALCAGDEDWFKVNLALGDDLTITINFTDADGDLNLRLYNPALLEIDASTSVADSETVNVTDAPAAGSYYARVLGASVSDGNDYTMTVTHPGSGSPCYAFFQRYIISTLDGLNCCDCNSSADPTCQTGSAFTVPCCWGDGDWDMWVLPGGAGVAADGLSSEIEILLSPDPYSGSWGSNFTVYFSGTLNCATGGLVNVSSDFCELMSGNLTSLTGTLTALVAGSPCGAAQCTSNWEGVPAGWAVCGAVACYMCEDSNPADFAPSSAAGKESIVLRRMKERGYVRPAPHPSSDARPRRER